MTRANGTVWSEVHTVSGEDCVIWLKMISGKQMIHRDFDKPAILHNDGTLIWYSFGRAHRPLPKPAYIFPNKNEHFYVYGKQVENNFVTLGTTINLGNNNE